MMRLLGLAGVLLFGATASGQQPRIIEIQQPLVSTRALEESLEQLVAALDVKKAHIKAAEVAVTAVKFKQTQVQTDPEKELCKIELDAALAQLDIRKAEAREVEVRIKQIRKRLEDSKGGSPKSNESPTSDLLEASVKIAKLQLEKAKLKLKGSEDEVVRLQDLAKKGIVALSDIAAAELAVATAKIDLEVAKTTLQSAETKLKDFQKHNPSR